MFTPTALDKMKDAVEASMDAKVERAIKPFNVFVQRRSDQIHQEMEAAGIDKQGIKKQWLQYAWSLWEALPAHEKAHYVSEADASTAARTQEALAEDKNQRELLRLAQQRKAEHDAAFGIPNHLAACKYTEADLDRMADIALSLNGAALRRSEDTTFEGLEPRSGRGRLA